MIQVEIQCVTEIHRITKNKYAENEKKRKTEGKRKCK